ncbi:hypothetical protein Tco_0562663, partial [Tanacetum coccineum]
MRKVSSSSSDGGLLHVDFWHISSGKDGLVESSVLDDVKDDL